MQVVLIMLESFLNIKKRINECNNVLFKSVEYL